MYLPVVDERIYVLHYFTVFNQGGLVKGLSGLRLHSGY